MSNNFLESEGHLMESLQRLFTDQQSVIGQKISHPDPQVEEMAQLSTATFRKASVLIPVIKPSSVSSSQIVLTVRSNDLSSHAGQVSLPGGTREIHDVDDIETALRESEEEIGLSPESVEIIGQLGDIQLPSGFQVTPVIGLIEPEPQLTPCPIEVSEIFMVPTVLLLNPESYSFSIMEYQGKPRRILELHFEGYRIWGATAVILHHLASQLDLKNV